MNMFGNWKMRGNLTVPVVCCSEHYKLENSTSDAQNVYSKEIRTEHNHVQSISFTYLSLQGSETWTTVQHRLKILIGLHGSKEFGCFCVLTWLLVLGTAISFFLVGTISGSTYLPRRSAPSLSLRGYFRLLAWLLCQTIPHLSYCYSTALIQLYSSYWLIRDSLILTAQENHRLNMSGK